MRQAAVKAGFHSGFVPKNLTCHIHKLVGSFFNRHAVTPKGSDCL